MQSRRPPLYFLAFLGFHAAYAQVGDVTMESQQAGYNPNSPYPYYGPRNYVPSGNFNWSSPLSVSSCNNSSLAEWIPGYNYMDGTQYPAPLFSQGTIWPYAFKWYCDFNEFYPVHPATHFWGVLSADLYGWEWNGVERYNYILFELKKPLAPGVEFTFHAEVSGAGAGGGTLLLPTLDQIGFALTHEIPNVDTLFAFADSIQPFVLSPPGQLIEANTFTFSDTIIGNGERYLIAGLFTPLDSHSVSHAPSLDAHYRYLFDNIFLFRTSCDSSNAQFYRPLSTACSTDTTRIGTQPFGGVSSIRHWIADGVDWLDSTGTTVHVPYSGTDSTVMTFVCDTGMCLDSARHTIYWMRVDPDLTDTFTVCSEQLVLVADTQLYNVSYFSTTAYWEELTGPFSAFGNNILVTLPDSGIYALQMQYAGCYLFDTLVVGPDRPLLDTNSFGAPYLWSTSVPEHCINMNDGIAAVYDNGYPADLHFDWYDTPDAGVDTSLADSLPSGTWHVRITDAQYRCGTLSVTVPQLLNLCASIQGVVFEDSALNCVRDPSDQGHALRTVTALPIGNIGVSASDGSYEILVPPGNYTVSAEPSDPLVGNVCGNGAAVSLPTAGMVVANMDVADSTHIPVHDLELTYLLFPWVIGTGAELRLVLRNKGEFAEPGILRIVLDHPTLDFDQSLPGAVFLGLAGDTLLFDAGMIYPAQSVILQLTCSIPPDPGLLNQAVPFHAQVLPAPGEVDLSLNAVSDDALIVGAYDPNDKLVSPYGDPATHAVDTTVNQLRYTIRFQNTGNYPATNVRLEDPLPSLLLPLSLHVLGASHPVQCYSFGQTLYFEFLSIMLPDSASDPDGSQGWVCFTLDVAPSATYGDSINNVAAIYFDLNPPILTPPALTWFSNTGPLSTSNDPEPNATESFRLAPNPTMEHVAILSGSIEESIVDVELLTISGSRVDPIRWSSEQGINVQVLDSGTYLVRISTARRTVTLPLVKY